MSITLEDIEKLYMAWHYRRQHDRIGPRSLRHDYAMAGNRQRGNAGLCVGGPLNQQYMESRKPYFLTTYIRETKAFRMVDENMPLPIISGGAYYWNKFGLWEWRDGV